MLLYYRKRIIFTLDMTGTHKLLTQIKHTFGRDTFIKSEKAPGTGVVANTLPCPAVSAPRSTAQEHGLGSGLPWTCRVLCPAWTVPSVRTWVSWQKEELITRG